MPRAEPTLFLACTTGTAVELLPRQPTIRRQQASLARLPFPRPCPADLRVLQDDIAAESAEVDAIPHNVVVNLFTLSILKNVIGEDRKISTHVVSGIPHLLSPPSG